MAGTKRKAETEIPIMDENDLLKITPLGAGNEVGRSSILMEYKGKTILVSQKNDFGFGSYLKVVYSIIKIKSVLFLPLELVFNCFFFFIVSVARCWYSPCL